MTGPLWDAVVSPVIFALLWAWASWSDRRPRPCRRAPLGLVLRRVRECEDGLRAAGWSAAADEVYALGLVLGRDRGGRRPVVLRLGWWLPLGSSNLFDGPGARLFFWWRLHRPSRS